MIRTSAAAERGRAGERVAARHELEAMWAEVEGGGNDDFHRCAIAQRWPTCRRTRATS